MEDREEFLEKTGRFRGEIGGTGETGETGEIG
jgi:hypothetical protein